MSRQKITIVWLKRDLRTNDHGPLNAAALLGLPTLVLYCFEPTLLADARHSSRHWRFVYESLEDLRQRGLPVHLLRSEVVDALDMVQRDFEVVQLLCHQETGHLLSFRRDRAVRKWCAQHGVGFQEYVQDGVIRGRKHRDGFKEHLEAFINQKPLRPAWREGNYLSPDTTGLPTADFPEWMTNYQPGFQRGGASYAHRYMDSFVRQRAANYAYHLGNPSLSRKSCSRLSPYLAWGCLSLREAIWWADQAHHIGPDGKKRRLAQVPALKKQLAIFRDRLLWRVHYYQKLEAEWQLEFNAICRPLDTLDRTTDPDKLNAWKTGQTGVPMVDAAMRCLIATGWLNFRLRAMLVTFASYALWLDWRAIAQHLGQLFLDYDPGIHYAQLQMQAGTTGYHPPRTFNPYILGEKYDANGDFLYHWVPELKGIPAPFCHYPHRLTPLEQQLYPLNPTDYPVPIVDYETAVATNLDRYWAIRKSAAAQAVLPAIWAKHCYPKDRERYAKQLVENTEAGSRR